MTTIELSNTNLYANGTLIEFPDGDGLLLATRVAFVGDELDTWHTVKSDDRLDIIAWRAYKDQTPRAAKLWWAIAYANNIYNPFDLSEYVGKDILVPDFKKILLNT